MPQNDRDPILRGVANCIAGLSAGAVLGILFGCIHDIASNEMSRDGDISYRFFGDNHSRFPYGLLIVGSAVVCSAVFVCCGSLRAKTP